MKRKFIIFGILTTFLFFFYISNCNRSDPTSPTDKNTSILKFNFTSIPTQVTKIIVALSRTNFDTLIQIISVTGTEAYCQFNEVAAGNWHIRADAKNNADSILYTGETDVTVIAGQTVKVYLELKAVGNLDIHVTWGEKESYTFIYNFDDEQLQGWGGPANAEASQKMLHLWSTIGFKWHTISYSSTLYFIEGIIEFDVQPLDGGYTFETKGGTQSSNILNWGVYMRWKTNSIYVHASENSDRILKNTQVTYEPENWYHIKIKFNGNNGSKGRFAFWSKNITTGGDEIFGGEYDYFAEYGALYGVNQFSLGVYDTKIPQTEEKHIYFDNFYFKVKP